MHRQTAQRYSYAWLNQVLWQLFPARCLVCAGKGAAQRDLCPACELELPQLKVYCERCAEPLSKAGLCGRCQQYEPHYDKAIAPFVYAPPLDRLIKGFKFNKRLEAGRLLADLMADFLEPVARPDCLLPVPLHPNRLRERGFNQALELARPLAKRLAVPLQATALQRVRDTPQQAQMTLGERQRNLRGAFILHEKLKARHVAIIDDVMTSGSTVDEVARVLRTAGVTKIQVWICARTSINI